MVERHRFAILIADDPGGSPPAVAIPDRLHIQRIFDTGAYSVRRFWEENVPFLDLEMKVFPAITISPPMPGPGEPDKPRTELIDFVIRQATAEIGFDQTEFDHVVVVVHGGSGYEMNAAGSNAVLSTAQDFSTYCHEVGHVLGFDHSRGFWNFFANGVWTTAYGSRYDVMAIRGDWMLPVQDTVLQDPGFERHAGPMVARAVIHYFKPEALAEDRKVLELDLRRQDRHQVTLWAAGRGLAGEPELILLHSDGDRADPKRRIYIEYRQPNPMGTDASRWDLGLDGSGMEITPGNFALDTPGVVIHTVQTATWPDGTPAFGAPTFTASIALDGSDRDVDVEFPWGTYVVSLDRDEPVPYDSRPAKISLTVSGTPLGEPQVRLRSSVTEDHVVVATEHRYDPRLPGIFGPQPFDVYRTDTTWTLWAHTRNAGGTGEEMVPQRSTLRWVVDGAPLPEVFGTPIPLAPAGLLEAIIDATTQALTLRTVGALASSIDVPVEVRAFDDNIPGHLSATTTLPFEGPTSGPSRALDSLLHWWRLKNRKQRVPGPRPLWEMIELRAAWQRVVTHSPAVGHRFQPWMDVEEALRREELQRVAAKLRRRMPR